MSLARFTPSLLDEETLERLFVNREALLDDAVERVALGANSDARPHKLYVGPRGAGKTHLISLVYYRAKRLIASGAHTQISWLPEDPWTIGSYEDFLEEVLRHLDREPAGDNPEDAVVRAARERGPIVVLVENLDQILGNTGPDDQRRLRALLENDRPLLLMATATRLTEDLISQAEPFYGFFDTTTLRPFDVDEAAEMLKAIASVRGEDALVVRLDEQRARNRLAAVKHLAGGQPRVWALLGAGLSIDRVDDMVSMLLERFDDLTPYYQEQLARLSTNERKVVRALADADRSMTVRALSEATRIEQRSLAKTITELRRRGWVRARTGPLVERVDRRLTYYELAEPLARIAFQLKAAKGEPVRLVIDFMTRWFDRVEIERRADDAASPYLHAAQIALGSEPVLALNEVLRDGRPRRHSTTPTSPELRYTRRVWVNDPGLDRALRDLDDALTQYIGGDARFLLEQPAHLSDLVERRLRTASASRLRVELARVAYEVGDAERWIARTESAIEAAEPPEQVYGLLTLLLLHAKAGETSAVTLTVSVLADRLSQEAEPELAGSLLDAGEELIRAGHPEAALRLLDAAAPAMNPRWQLARSDVVTAAQLALGDVRAAVAVWEDAVSAVAQGEPTDRAALIALNNLAKAYRDAGRPQDALTTLQRIATASDDVLGPDHPDSLTIRNNLAFAFEEAGRVDDALTLYRRVLADRERTLGPHHPETLIVRNNLAYAYQSAGRLIDALPQYERVLADRERLLGHDHPHTLISRNNLAHAYQTAGRPDDALPLFMSALADLERVLGPHHPDTVTVCINLAYAYRTADRLLDALPLFERVLSDLEHALGDDHAQTVEIRGCVAEVRASIAATASPRG